jgi:hypothetical protein
MIIDKNVPSSTIMQVSEGSSVYACAVAKRLLQAVDAQHQALNIFN